MKLMKNWPESIKEYLREIFGQATEIQRLSGIKAQGGAFRLKFKDKSLIVKKMEKPQEYLFYTKCKPLLNEFYIHIPDLYWSHYDGKSYWIIIEDIVNQLPKERWQGDEKIIEALFKLHSESWEKPLPLEDYYLPRWDYELTEFVLNLYKDNISMQLKPLLIEAQGQFQKILKPYCWINGDTNPTNWGIREDGTVVLFDWERISMSNPIIDLSITMPGLGTSDNSLEKIIAKNYLKYWEEGPCFSISQEELVKQIRLTKIWTAVEFLTSNWDTQDKDTIYWILDELINKLYEFEKLK